MFNGGKFIGRDADFKIYMGIIGVQGVTHGVQACVYA